ncbi:hypothetical protein DKX38_004548 [Salix brachista]|uniref:GST N-terminal domain-containing protein n=1 Tax=Salix brachista TaxID=2182728 RepID=A0A5N5NAJ6_9ROSI|nr:hypothetical protein DKX38_004548 [Salix brachista]
MELKVYVDRLSQPSRAIVIFCKVNKIDFEEVGIDLLKGQHLTPEFKEINPMGKVPAIVVDGKFKLFESHAILIFLASACPGVADHWYPADPYRRAEIHSILDWHHSNLRRGSAEFIQNTLVAPFFGRPLNPQAAVENEKVLSSSLSKIEALWLKESGQFLHGSSQPSIADLCLVCEIMQLELSSSEHQLDVLSVHAFTLIFCLFRSIPFLGETDRNRILGPFKKIQRWIEDTKNATNPYFDEVHQSLFAAKAKLQMPMLSIALKLFWGARDSRRQNLRHESSRGLSANITSHLFWWKSHRQKQKGEASRPKYLGNAPRCWS